MPWVKLFEDIAEVRERFGDKNPILLNVREQKVCLVFNKDQMFAFDNNCPHNGAPLHRGHCNDNLEIVCPLHFYQFNMKSGREGLGRKLELNTYPLRIDNSSLYIRLKDEAQ